MSQRLPEAAFEALNEAKDALNKGELQRARRLALKAVRLAPDFEDPILSARVETRGHPANQASIAMFGPPSARSPPVRDPSTRLVSESVGNVMVVKSVILLIVVHVPAEGKQ